MKKVTGNTNCCLLHPVFSFIPFTSPIPLHKDKKLVVPIG